MTPPDATLVEVLADAQRLGFLGPGPVADQLALAAGLGMAFESVAGVPPALALDLGSGGGVPGLVLAERWPATRWVLLDSQERRTAFLAAAVRRLGLESRIVVVRERAEVAGHDPTWRGQFDLVVARSFGPPPVTAECGAPFLRLGGWLLVADPPDRAGAEARWPADGIGLVGLVHGRGGSGPPAWTALRQTEPCPAPYPRRTGLPAKRPLYPVAP